MNSIYGRVAFVLLWAGGRDHPDILSIPPATGSAAAGGMNIVTFCSWLQAADWRLRWDWWLRICEHFENGMTSKALRLLRASCV